MTASTDDEMLVLLWVRRIREAIDESSPFAGMADLRGIAKLPLPVQKRIHESLTPDQAAAYRRLYGGLIG